MTIRSQPPDAFARPQRSPSDTELRLAELRERRAVLELERERLNLQADETRLLESQARSRELATLFEDSPHPQPADGVDYQRKAQSRELFEAYGSYDYLDIIGPGGAASTWGQPLGYGMQSYLNPLSTRVDRAQGRDRPFVITEVDLGFIRGVARIVCEINCPAKGAIRNLVNYTVGGKGLQYAIASKSQEPERKPPDGLIPAVQEVIDEFLERVKWCGALGKEGELVRRWFRDGEYFLQSHCDRVGRTDVRFVEPEQITEMGAHNWTPQMLAEYGIDIGEADIDTTFGILTPKHDVNVRWAYNAWFDDLGESDLLPADSLQHFKLSDTNIKRGISDFYGAVKWLQRSDNLLTKTAGGAAIQAAIAGIRKHASGVTQSDVSAFRASKTDYTTTAYMPNGGSRTFNNYSYPDGTILDIPFGLDWDQPPQGADRGPAFVEVAQAMLRWIACQWSMPEFMISGDASNNNYSSSLVSEAPFVKNVQGLQFGFGSMWHDLLWRVIYNAARYGRFDRFGDEGSYYALKRLLKLHVTYPTIETRDRNLETTRLKTLCDDGIISPKKRAAEEGYDYAEEQAQGAKQRPAEITAKADGMDSGGGVTSLAAGSEKGNGDVKPEQPGDSEPDPDGEGDGGRPQQPQPAQPGAAPRTTAEQPTARPTHESSPVAESIQGTDDIDQLALNLAMIHALQNAVQISPAGIFSNHPAAVNESDAGFDEVEDPLEEESAEEEPVDDDPLEEFMETFDPDKHPRGQPGNAGEFGPGGGQEQTATTEKKAQADKQQSSKKRGAGDQQGHQSALEKQNDWREHGVKSQAFKSWFGDWQKDPAKASKVVDSDGKPLVVYHGTKAEFQSFDKAKQGANRDSGDWGAGFYFGDQPKAAAYGHGDANWKLMPVYLDIKHPFVVEGPRNADELTQDHPALPALVEMFGKATFDEAISNAEDLPSIIRNRIGSKKFTETLQQHGYDGFLRKYRTDSYEWTAFEPNQIKSASGNRGTFDPKSDKITETNAGVGPGSFGDISGYNANASGLVGKPKKPKALQESNHDVSGEGRDQSGKWTKGAGGGASGGEQHPDAAAGESGHSSSKDLSAEELSNKLVADGGFTYRPLTQTMPNQGYAVSVSNKYEKVLSREEATPEAIQAYLDDHADVFKSDPTAAFGAWIDQDTGRIYLDISHVFADKEEAIRLAHQHGQEGIYDLEHGETIITKPREQRRGIQEAGAIPVQSGSDSPGDPRGPPRNARQPKAGGPRQVAESEPDSDLRAAIAAAAEATNTDPTPAQAEAGTYKKGRFRWHGLTIVIENPKGSVRTGVDEDGNEWESGMDLHYGYISKSEGADGDHVDVFVGPDPESELVFVVDQLNADGSFDEHKALIGFDTEQAARDGYLSAYEDGWDRLGAIVAMTLKQFLGWIEHGNTALPASIYESAPPEDSPRVLLDRAMEIVWGSGKVYP